MKKLDRKIRQMFILFRSFIFQKSTKFAFSCYVIICTHRMTLWFVPKVWPGFMNIFYMYELTKKYLERNLRAKKGVLPTQHP